MHVARLVDVAMTLGSARLPREAWSILTSTWFRRLVLLDIHCQVGLTLGIELRVRVEKAKSNPVPFRVRIFRTRISTFSVALPSDVRQRGTLLVGPILIARLRAQCVVPVHLV
jgi:hypothetical protein